MRHHHRLRGLVVAAALSLLVALPVGFASAKDFKARFRGSALAVYTDNVFNLSDEQIDEFDDQQAPGERFFDMDDPEDVVTRLRVRSTLSWKVAKKRYLSLDARASYFLHARNSIADFPRLDLEVGYDITRKDTVYAGVDLIFDRFWKNYKVANTNIFAPAEYDQSILRLGYKRNLRKHWLAGGEYRRQDRDYDAPLESRDRDGDYLAGFTKYRMSKRVDAGSRVRYGEVDTPTEIDSGIPEDRSYTEWFVQQQFDFELADRFLLMTRVDFRRREADTSFSQDLARFDRVDERLRLTASLRVALRKDLELRIDGTYVDNDSDRKDPTIEVDELGHEEKAFGAGLIYRF